MNPAEFQRYQLAREIERFGISYPTLNVGDSVLELISEGQASFPISRQAREDFIDENFNSAPCRSVSNGISEFIDSCAEYVLKYRVSQVDEAAETANLELIAKYDFSGASLLHPNDAPGYKVGSAQLLRRSVSATLSKFRSA